MLILTGECQYTLLGLSQLIYGPHQTLNTAQWLAANNVPAEACLLMVASRGYSLADLLPIAEKARFNGIRQMALLGHEGQGVFMGTCGLAPDCVIDPEQSPKRLALRINDWLRFHSSRHHSGMAYGRQTKMLTQRELEILRISLTGMSVPVASFGLGISQKTFYSLRMNALNRLGLKNIRSLLVNPATGVPDPINRYDCLLDKNV